VFTFATAPALPPIPPQPLAPTPPPVPTEEPAQTFPSLESIQNQAELDKVIMALDLALFDAYNRCDLQAFSSFLADDVEFYHDQGGVTLGNANLTASVKKNICGGDVRRELVPGTFQANYMKGYGAVELGVHRFVHPKSNNPTGEGRFVHLWQYKDGKWKVTRVISYDHHQAQPDPAKVAPAK
jgi:ketosteroid isomerase-like protein